MASSDEMSAEERLIAKYFGPLATAPGAFGLHDDAAAITPPPGCDLVLTTDGVIAGVHFFESDPAGDIARRVLRMNLSDLAGKGATPLGFLVAIALPSGIDESWIAAFAKGLGDDAKHYACALLGGDTDHTPGRLSVSIAAFGSVPQGKMVKRSTAKAGDSIVVTGSIGDAALGLLLQQGKHCALTSAQRAFLEDRYRLPLPRNALADAVLAQASAAMDVSDGLAGDLAKLCRTSDVAADIDVARVPLSEAARAVLTGEPALLETVLTGGDDYEILLTLRPEKLAAFQAAAAQAGVAATEIGRTGAGHGTRFIRDGKPMSFARPSYSHF
jgi:thiamine-monophosphate kinase